MTWLIDSHIHLSDPQYDKEISFIINGMRRLLIKACCVSMDYETSMKTLALSKKSELILPFIGIHPEKYEEEPDQLTNLIEQHHQEISGIGEIGLDRTYANSEEDFNKQKKIFQNLLCLAEKYNKPISIHSRKTLNEIFEIIPSFSLKGKLLHWFDGSKKQLNKAMDMDFFVSYGPVLVYAQEKQILLQNTVRDKILVETDGPVKFSKCFGFKPAQISFIPSVVFCASKVLKEAYNDLEKVLEKNSNTYLGI